MQTQDPCGHVLKVSIEFKNKKRGDEQGKSKDVIKIADIQDLVPIKWSTVKFLSRGYFPSGLPPSFYTSRFARVASNYKTLARKLDSKGKISFAGTPYSFPRPGVHDRRRVSYLVNPVSALIVSLAMEDNWAHIREKLTQHSRCTLETSLPIEDREELRYIIPAMTHTKLYSLLDHVHAAYQYVIKADIQAFYPSLYTHALEWAMVGKKVAKKNYVAKCSQHSDEKHRVGCELDRAIRMAQERETYGVPIGIDSSFVASELVGKGIIETVINKMKENNINDYYVVRHVDDMSIFTNDDPNKIVSILRSSFREWNFLPNETKFEINTSDYLRQDLWVYQLASYHPDGDNKEVYLSDIVSNHSRHKAGRDSVAYQVIDYWNLERYFSLMRSLQRENTTKSVIAYGLRRLHFNQRIDPLKGYGKRYMMNSSETFYKNLDSQLSLLLTSYPQYVDVISDVYLWYHLWLGYKPSHIKSAINLIIRRYADKHEHQFELVWTLWLARHFSIVLPRQTIEYMFEKIGDPVVALQAIDYAWWWERTTQDSLSSVVRQFVKRVRSGGTNIEPATSIEEAFTSASWLFYYSLFYCDWDEVASLQLKFSKPHSTIAIFIDKMKRERIQFFSWRRKIRELDRLLGVSRKGRGGVTARVYPV